jgi:hypothetical protein
MYRAVGVLCLLALPAHGETLLQQVAGTWTLTSGVEVKADGSKSMLWGSGNQILDPSGHMSFFVFARERKSEGPSDPRVPAGPMVAYYGTWSTDEDTKTITYRVDEASAPSFNGMTRTQMVTVTPETLITKGSIVKTAQGEITPINTWRRAR